MNKDLDLEKKLAAKEAVKFIKNNQIIGLGTGSTAVYAIREIGKMVKNGLQIQAVATSGQTEKLAQSLNIPLVEINSIDSIDITIDGADEFSTNLILIKGGGGALFKEKIVAALTKELIIIADSSKKVDLLGKFKLPIEVVPFASNYVLNQIKFLNGIGEIRLHLNDYFITEQGNYIIDCDFGLIENPIFLAEQLKKIEGIVAHGLFISLASKVIMGTDESIITFL
nr:ribose-5-phosphate isomerase RpiA [uncultured Flavobacterium sp.]